MTRKRASTAHATRRHRTELTPIEKVKIDRTDRASRANPHISRSAARRARAACSCSWTQENVAYFVQSLERRSYIGAYPPPKASSQEHGKETTADRVNGGGSGPVGVSRSGNRGISSAICKVVVMPSAILGPGFPTIEFSSSSSSPPLLPPSSSF